MTAPGATRPETWVPVPAGSDFPLENLPFGIVRPRTSLPRPALRIGDHIVDLSTLTAAGLLDIPSSALLHQSRLNALMASGLGPSIRQQVSELLGGTPEGRAEEALVPIDEVDVLLPIAVGDYVDFYSSLHHAENLGRMMRPDSDPILPNWRHLPVGYHGRSGTVRVSGTDIVRPEGLAPAGDGKPELVATRALDIELEVGFIVGRGGTRIHPDDAGRHVFGVVLLNDWSARDIQAFEGQPLGPNLAKSFATTISPWVITLDALGPYLVEPPVQDPVPHPYLQAQRPWALDLNLEIWLNGERISATSFRDMYWTFAQQLAHMTVNGATTATGDLFGSGTVSGPTKAERGSLIELTWRGSEPLTLADGSTRSFLLDGDTVVLRGWCGGDGPDRPRIGLGQASGTILPAPAR
ncbi:MAG TPA: fumarylacetoacetase [Acidimicrobiales bacterium]|nr:fumarylacetoacetase [Acidimicrobiales bacterium]